jgi:divalent metal cation (Fe/Co/Zn/Cd) transporter
LTAAVSPSKQKVARLAGWSIVVALAVLALKTFAWRITGSVALYSDALESIANVMASGGAFWAIQVSHKPAASTSMVITKPNISRRCSKAC